MRFIFDLDHTLIDSSHRQLTREDGSLDLTAWRENCTAEKISRDSLLPLANECRALIGRHVEVILARLALWNRPIIPISRGMILILIASYRVQRMTAPATIY